MFVKSAERWNPATVRPWIHALLVNLVIMKIQTFCSTRSLMRNSSGFAGMAILARFLIICTFPERSTDACMENPSMSSALVTSSSDAATGSFDSISSVFVER